MTPELDPSEAGSQPSGASGPSGGGDASSPPHRPRRRKRFNGVVEVVLTVVIAVLVALGVQRFLIKPYKIPSGSMIPTLQIGQRILVNRLDRDPSIGDVVVFHPSTGADSRPAVCGNAGQGAGRQQACDTPVPAESTQTFVKRVVGLPGDHLRIVDGHVYRNGVEERGSYIQQCDSGQADCDFPQTIVVPKGDYYMMGDNRGISDDSRFWGPVPQRWIVGVAFFTYWPISRIGTL